MANRLTLEKDRKVGFVTIDNPPVNVITPALYQDLQEMLQAVDHDDSIKVLVLQSADPDFFIAHFDVEALLAMPTKYPAKRSQELNPFHLMCERLRTMPKATLVKMAGRAGGGGNELAASCDMRFGVRSKTIINQMEVPLGILPGGSGTQRLTQLLGRSRALEICLGGDDIDAETCFAWGYLNRIFDSIEELNAFVDRLAYRIAQWPKEAISLCKQSVNNMDLPTHTALVEEAYLFQQSIRTQEAQESMSKAMELGLQTRKGEMKIAELMQEVSDALGSDS